MTKVFAWISNILMLLFTDVIRARTFDLFNKITELSDLDMFVVII